jgi:hypothetical protein
MDIPDYPEEEDFEDLEYLEYLQNLQKLVTKYISIYTSFPKDFMDKPDCPEKARLLKDLFYTLTGVKEFRDFYNALISFSVKTKDSIYYPCCEECDGLFCVNKRYVLPKYLEESRQFLFKRTSSHRKQSTRRVKKSKSIPKKSKRGSARARRAIKSPRRKNKSKSGPARERTKK